MAVGDVKAGISAIAQNQFLDIKPAAGEEWNLRAIFYEDWISIEFYDNSKSLIFEASINEPSKIYYCHIDMTNVHRVRVKNNAEDTRNIGYAARQIK